MGSAKYMHAPILSLHLSRTNILIVSRADAVLSTSSNLGFAQEKVGALADFVVVRARGKGRSSKSSYTAR